MKLKQALVVLSLTVGVLVMLVVLAFAALAAYSYHKSTQANKAAKAFCDSLVLGTELPLVLKKIGTNSTWNDYKVFENQHRFIYYGAPLYTRECVVTVDADKIRVVQLESND